MLGVPLLGTLTGLDGGVPVAAIVVTAESLFVHCPASLKRSGAWDPDSGTPDRDELAAAVRTHWKHVKAAQA